VTPPIHLSARAPRPDDDLDAAALRRRRTTASYHQQTRQELTCVSRTVVFRLAGVYGIVVLIPMYFLFDQPGGTYEPPIPYPQAYHGFLSVAMAWQVAFLVIASDPVRFRPMMIPTVLEKVGIRRDRHGSVRASPHWRR
jgi:hypothetical protein